MKIAFCYESVLPARGGCETYIADLARRLAADGHQIYLYASRWDAARLPAGIVYRPLNVPRAPRFIRPWLFASACAAALAEGNHDVSIGFDKTWGQDVLYPQGGLHSASADHNLLKHRGSWARRLAGAVKRLDLAHWSFARLERRQYLEGKRPLIVVNSEMVRRHFHQYLGMDPQDVRIVPSAIDPQRFREIDRPRRRQECRQRWGLPLDAPVAVFVAMNYELKGLAPLLYALQRVPAERRLHLLVAGHPRFAAYEKLARSLGVADRVRFIGYCADSRDCYFAGDFLVHPTFYDPCSLVVLEALACGLPIITSRYNGASELLTPPLEGHVIRDPHDHAQLAQAMMQLLDPARRTACAQAARRTAARWTFADHYRALTQIFREAAARKQAA